MAAVHTITPDAVRSTRNIIGEAVSARHENSPAFPSPSDFASEEDFCEAFLQAIGLGEV